MTWSQAQFRYFNRGIGPHGTRSRYIHAKCRCQPCKKANRLYCRTRRKAYRNSNPDQSPTAFVFATRSRNYLRKLRRHSIGLRVVAEITEISFGHLQIIRAGKTMKVQLRTQKKILRVPLTAHADGAVIPGAKTAQMVSELREEGFTYEQLAFKFEMNSEVLERLVRRKHNVQAKTQMKVEKFYNRIMVA